MAMIFGELGVPPAFVVPDRQVGPTAHHPGGVRGRRGRHARASPVKADRVRPQLETVTTGVQLYFGPVTSNTRVAAQSDGARRHLNDMRSDLAERRGHGLVAPGAIAIGVFLSRPVGPEFRRHGRTDPSSLRTRSPRLPCRPGAAPFRVHTVHRGTERRGPSPATATCPPTGAPASRSPRIDPSDKTALGRWLHLVWWAAFHRRTPRSPAPAPRRGTRKRGS